MIGQILVAQRKSQHPLCHQLFDSINAVTTTNTDIFTFDFIRIPLAAPTRFGHTGTYDFGVPAHTSSLEQGSAPF